MKTVTKSEVRESSQSELDEFLANGGIIEIVKPKKEPKQKMKAKGTRNKPASTSGFAVGAPSISLRVI